MLLNSNFTTTRELIRLLSDPEILQYFQIVQDSEVIASALLETSVFAYDPGTMHYPMFEEVVMRSLRKAYPAKVSEITPEVMQDIFIGLILIGALVLAGSRDSIEEPVPTRDELLVSLNSPGSLRVILHNVLKQRLDELIE